jgi:hypothetical protein
VLATIHITFFHFFTFFKNNQYENIFIFFTFYIISIIFYYYSNKKIHYHTNFFFTFYTFCFILYHFSLNLKLTTTILLRRNTCQTSPIFVESQILVVDKNDFQSQQKHLVRRIPFTLLILMLPCSYCSRKKKNMQRKERNYCQI